MENCAYLRKNPGYAPGNDQILRCLKNVNYDGYFFEILFQMCCGVSDAVS